MELHATPCFHDKWGPGTRWLGPGQHLPLPVILSQISQFLDRGTPVHSLCSLCLYWVPVTCLHLWIYSELHLFYYFIAKFKKYQSSLVRMLMVESARWVNWMTRWHVRIFFKNRSLLLKNNLCPPPFLFPLTPTYLSPAPCVALSDLRLFPEG